LVLEHELRGACDLVLIGSQPVGSLEIS
jgi:hypothetical protein